MSNDQMTRGLEMIASAAEKVDLHLGSRAVDLFRGMVRISFEKEVQSGSRSQFRAPTFEFSREFVEDLPAQKEYQTRMVKKLVVPAFPHYGPRFLCRPMIDQAWSISCLGQTAHILNVCVRLPHVPRPCLYAAAL